MRHGSTGTWIWLGLAVIAIAPWAMPRDARACSCMMPPPPIEALEQADAVFEARPFSMSNDQRRAYYSFEVDRVWKGDVGPRVEVATALHSAACGRSYQIGTRYVIYARRTDDEWVDGLCSRTRASQSASEDLQVLGAGHSPVSDEPIAEGGGPEPTEPPRIDAPPPTEPPPPAPSRRGCAMEKPHAHEPGGGLALLVLAVAIGRRRAVRSPRPR